MQARVKQLQQCRLAVQQTEIWEELEVKYPAEEILAVLEQEAEMKMLMARLKVKIV